MYCWCILSQSIVKYLQIKYTFLSVAVSAKQVVMWPHSQAIPVYWRREGGYRVLGVVCTFVFSVGPHCSLCVDISTPFRLIELIHIHVHSLGQAVN